MTTAAIRKQLMTYIADADDKKVKAIYTLVEDAIKQDEDFTLSDEQWKIVEKRRARHIAGKDKSIPWQQAHDSIRKKRKSHGV